MNKIKIFFITTELPSRTSGAPVRNYNLIKQISKVNFSVSLFTILDDKKYEILPKVKQELNIPIFTVWYKYLSSIKSLLISLTKRVIPYMEEYRESGIANILLDKINKEHPAIIQLEETNAYYAIRNIIPFIKEKNIKIIFDAHNVDRVAFRETLKIFNIFKNSIGKWILPNFTKIENEAIKSADHIFTCSDSDKAFFANIVNTKKISVIPNGVDTTHFRSNNNILENTLLFMGGANYPPNEEALKYYLSQIHPIIKEIIPNIKIYILGSKPSQWIKNIAKSDPSIIVTGFVKDVREYLNKTKICISPIKSGSGTSLKILEYMSMEKPVVSTSIGARGLKIKNQYNILIADKPDEFADKIVWLIKNQDEAREIGRRARILVNEIYDWKLINEKVESIYKKIAYEIK